MASISQARTWFRKRSGRYDLTTEDIDQYLNQGQQFLDQITEYQKAPTKLQSTTAAGDIFVSFSARMRVIQEVWVAKAGASKWELGKVTPGWIKETYPDPLASLQQGEPAYFTPDPMTYYNASGDFQYYAGAYADGFSNNGIIIMPPTDGVYLVEVTGRFYSQFISDSTSSWWLEQQSDALVKAAMRMLESDYRNTQGVKDWESALAPAIKGIHDDMAEEDSMTINRMEG